MRSFVQKCTLTLAPGQTFLDNWHLAAVAHRLEQVRLGQVRRLIISLPPRSLKSITASVAFPAFVLGHEPHRRIICVSYGQDLNVKHANDFRAVVDSSWYRQTFPGLRLSQSKNTEAEVVTTERGYRLSVSVGGPLTGRGGDLVIIDDPLKPQDALSALKRDGVNLWFSNTLLSRLDDKQTGAIVIVMQRVHMDDLVGFVTKLDPDWTVLELPAIAEVDEAIELGEGRVCHRHAGEALHPEREPLVVLQEIRRQLGSDLFSAQYQQRPVPPGGAMIKRNWVQRYVSLPPRTYRTRIIQSWDTASKAGAENDWSVCTTWQVEQNNYYLLDVERRRLDYPALKTLVIKLAGLYKPTKLLIEGVR